MEENNKIGFWYIIYWAILYPIGQRFQRDIRCWISHKWEWTDKKRNLRKCLKCKQKEVVIFATFEDDEDDEDK